MSSPDGSPERASLGQDGISVETDKTCGHDGEPRKSWGDYIIPKKTKSKDSIQFYTATNLQRSKPFTMYINSKTNYFIHDVCVKRES